MKDMPVNQTIQALDWLSVLANVFCLLLGLWFVSKRGGLPYLVLKVPLLKKLGIKSLQGNQAALFNFPYYDHRKSQLALLPIHPSDIIFLGDSITDEGEWAELLNNSAIKNRGISSDTTIGVLDRLHAIITPQPQKIFLMIGVNDLSNLGRSPAEVIHSYKEILTQIRERSPQTSVFIQSVLPINQTLFLGVTNSSIRAFNEQLQHLSTEFAYPYIDLHSHFLDAHHQLDAKYTSDGIHLNGSAYQHWQALIKHHVLS
jgi:lysophospholipase L1-like esterase